MMEKDRPRSYDEIDLDNPYARPETSVEKTLREKGKWYVDPNYDWLIHNQERQILRKGNLEEGTE